MKRVRDVLEKDGIWVAPSDTIYGISGNGLSVPAANRVRAAKGRGEKPFIYLVSDMEAAERYGSGPIPAAVSGLFLAGALTLVLPGQGSFGGQTVALRIATDPLAGALSRESGFPLISTSANVSQQPYRDDPEMIYAQFSRHVDLMVDAGPLGTTTPSAVLDLTGSRPVVLRGGRGVEEVVRNLE